MPRAQSDVFPIIRFAACLVSAAKRGQVEEVSRHEGKAGA